MKRDIILSRFFLKFEYKEIKLKKKINFYYPLYHWCLYVRGIKIVIDNSSDELVPILITTNNINNTFILREGVGNISGDLIEFGYKLLDDIYYGRVQIKS